MSRILIADPDHRCQEQLRDLLGPRGHQVAVVDDAKGALHAAETECDLLLAELSLPDSSGIELLNRLRQARPDLPIVLTTAFGSVEDAVQAMRSGAADFLGKPFAPEQVLVAVDRALEKATLVRENHDLKQALDDRLRLENLIGTDGRMQGIFKTVRAVADTRTTVLVTGESGTGKTLLARAIHNLSPRRNGPFIEVNCGALPETLLESELFGHVKGSFTGAMRDRPGKFEAAQRGTIFLDEIGTSSPAFQVRLLRVLQDRVIERVGDTQTIPVDVRVLIATNIDLEQAVKQGRFREDLYYRINVVPIEMPPLRARPGDVPFLADHFLRRFREEHSKQVAGFTQGACAVLTRAQWPGNVRQLENVIERAVVLCQGNRIDLGDLPPGLLAATPTAAGAAPPTVMYGDGPVLPLKDAMMGPEKAAIERALLSCGGNREAAAKVLGINRSTLFAKLRKHAIKQAGPVVARFTSPQLQYIAADVSRRRYGDDENVPPKVRRNVLRQFKVAMALEHAVRLVDRYRRMYIRAAALLPRYLMPQLASATCDWSHVRIPEFIAAMRRRHPREPVAVVRAVTWYVIHYEYLR